MKKFLIITVLSITLSSCSSQNVNTNNMQIELGQRIFIADSTLNVRDIELMSLRDSIKNIKIVKPVFLFNTDSLKDALFIARYRLERIRYHLKICQKKPSQDVFLKGWITRDLE